ncbi:MAG: DUF1925 domain-containing protein [Spirochaetaceae bacterium]|jgi:hypothetical protein|nr:DUF1925 domain-containing protein [Spirochaetaceae bacterium]
MEKSLNVFVGSDNHIPYSAEDSEFEYMYHQRLKPFILALNNYPRIKAALHYSGVLLHWIEKAHPEFFMLIGDLISRKQVELIGGGFYEPMMPLISQQDRIGQIEMLTTYIRKQFGKRPLGCWLPASAWDQSLVGALSACGMGYTFLRENQFRAAGLSGEDLYAPCITEDQGKLLMVFPVLKGLTLEGLKDSVVSLLQKTAAGTPPGGERLLVLCPDCFFQDASRTSGEAEINRFFEELSRCGDFLDFTIPSKIYKNKRCRKKAYFSASAAFEAPDSGNEPPPLPKRFLVRYSEANGIYSKMVYTGLLINQLRGDKARKQSAQEELWKGQGYDGFCRSPSGGIFRGGVRNAAYRALIEAEKITRSKGAFIPSLMTFDFDLDGEDEYLFQAEYISCYIKTLGASVFEFDFLPRSWNYLDTLGMVSAELPAPRSRRTSFADILAPRSVPPEDLALTGFDGLERDYIRYCGGETWDAGETDRAKKRAVFLLAPREHGAFSAIALRKEYGLEKDSLVVRYTLTNQGGQREDFNFIPRIDLAFPGEGELCQRIYRLPPDAAFSAEPSPVTKEPLSPRKNGVFSVSGAGAIEFQDLKNEVILTLSSGEKFDAAIRAVRSSSPVYGVETTLYQSTCVLPVRALSLAPEASCSAEFTLRLFH